MGGEGAVVAAQSVAEVSVVTGRHIQVDIGGPTVGMLQERKVDGTERERSYC